MIWPDRYDRLQEAWTDPRPGPDAIAERAEEERRLDDWLARLDPADRAVVQAALESYGAASARSLARSFGVSRYHVGRLLREVHLHVTGVRPEGPRRPLTANERARRWYRRLSPERKAERSARQKARREELKAS